MKKVAFADQGGPIIILVRPQLAENVGMVARAMMNCGLSKLRLVCPRENWLGKRAVSASSGAAVVLEQAKVYDSLNEALSDINVAFATTARVRDMIKRLIGPIIATQKTSAYLQKGEKVAWVFGPERTGLENSDLSLSDALVQIPLNPAHSSLNLSQAVLIMGYHWWTRSFKDQETLSTGQSIAATKQQLGLFLNHMDEVLEEKGYYTFKEKKERMRRNLHNIFERNGLTDSELRTLYNVLDILCPKKKKTLAKK
ncbi:MAG: RNA methyltransferase [Alphaproteobacteria bacterium]|nr:RNA methyltransferase [Alphaproteobacteria bacterium]